jgi:CubicO group peptidase (beta-lactamase class C family)
MSALDAIAGWPVGAAAAAVVGPDGVLETYGDQSAPFHLASVTKPLAGLATLIAVEEGALTLDDPAGPPGSTVRHLLAHAAGYALTTKDVLARPGTRRIYSNYGYDELGRHVERATGIAFIDYFRQALCDPLELRGTVLAGSPAHACTSTVADLTTVVTRLLEPEGMLHGSTVSQAATVQFPGLSGVVPGFGRQATNDWGLGFEIRDGKDPHWTGSRNSPATFGHFGRSGTFFWVDPVARLGLVVLTDTEFDRWAKDSWAPLADTVLAAYA